MYCCESFLGRAVCSRPCRGCRDNCSGKHIGRQKLALPQRGMLWRAASIRTSVFVFPLHDDIGLLGRKKDRGSKVCIAIKIYWNPNKHLIKGRVPKVPIKTLESFVFCVHCLFGCFLISDPSFLYFIMSPISQHFLFEVYELDEAVRVLSL